MVGVLASLATVMSWRCFPDGFVFLILRHQHANDISTVAQDAGKEQNDKMEKAGEAKKRKRRTETCDARLIYVRNPGPQ